MIDDAGLDVDIEVDGGITPGDGGRRGRRGGQRARRRHRACSRTPPGWPTRSTELRATAEAAPPRPNRLGRRRLPAEPGNSRAPLPYDRLACPSKSSPSPTALPPTRLGAPRRGWRRRAIRCAPVTVVVPSNYVGVAARRRLAAGARPHRRHVPHRLPPGRAARRRRARRRGPPARVEPGAPGRGPGGAGNAAPACSRRCATIPPPRRRWSPPTSSWPTSRRPPWPAWPRRRARRHDVVGLHRPCQGPARGLVRRGRPPGRGHRTSWPRPPGRRPARHRPRLPPARAQPARGRASSAPWSRPVRRSPCWPGSRATPTPTPVSCGRSPGSAGTAMPAASARRAGRRSDDAGDLRVITARTPTRRCGPPSRPSSALARAGTPLERIAIVHPGDAHYAAPGPPPPRRRRAARQRRRARPAGRPGRRSHAARPPPPGRRAAPSPTTSSGILAGAPIRRPGGGHRARPSRGSGCSREAGVVGTTPSRVARPPHPRWPRPSSGEAEAGGRRPRGARPPAPAATPSRPSRCATSCSASSTGSTRVAALRRWQALAARPAGAARTTSSAREQPGPPWPAEPSARPPTEVEAALDRLGHLDAVAAAADLDRFARALAPRARRRPRPPGSVRRRRAGRPARPRPRPRARPRRRRRHWPRACCPPASATTPSCPTAIGAAVADELPLAADRQRREHRQLLAAGRRAPTTSCSPCPRGDLRRTTEHVASRWLLDLIARRRTAPRCGPTSCSSAEAPWLTHVPSFAAGLRTSTCPATEQEARLALVVAGHPLPRRRSRYELGRPHGRGSRLAARSPPTTATWPASRSPSPASAGRSCPPPGLESWAACPYAYFVRYLLRVEPVENPEALLQLSALEQGTLVHSALEGYVAERVARAAPAGVADTRHAPPPLRAGLPATPRPAASPAARCCGGPAARARSAQPRRLRRGRRRPRAGSDGAEAACRRAAVRLRRRAAPRRARRGPHAAVPGQRRPGRPRRRRPPRRHRLQVLLRPQVPTPQARQPDRQRHAPAAPHLRPRRPRPLRRRAPAAAGHRPLRLRQARATASCPTEGAARSTRRGLDALASRAAT